MDSIKREKSLKKLLFLVSEDSYFCSHRLNLAKTALKAGYEVAVATKCKESAQKIKDAGIRLFPLKHFNRSGINPFRQIQLISEIWTVYRTYRPDIVHQVAMKPVVVGSLVAIACRLPKVINALGGLGYLFTNGDQKKTKMTRLKKGFLRKIITPLFTFIFSRSNSTLILQNTDDLAVLAQYCSVNPSQVNIIRGAGVDLSLFHPQPFPPEPPVVIVCVARMLWSKGIGELVEAAAILQKNNCLAKVILFGDPDPENPDTIPEAQLSQWQKEGLITWAGHHSDIPTVYANCHIAVLPSYREGLPKSLLEAASCGRPIVTTDAPGCREVVLQDENGLLVPIHDSTALATALIYLIRNPEIREKMGHAGRKRVEQYFSDGLVQQQTLELYSKTT